jgi:hypothetical protein
LGGCLFLGSFLLQKQRKFMTYFSQNVFSLTKNGLGYFLANFSQTFHKPTFSQNVFICQKWFGLFFGDFFTNSSEAGSQKMELRRSSELELSVGKRASLART